MGEDSPPPPLMVPEVTVTKKHRLTDAEARVLLFLEQRMKAQEETIAKALGAHDELKEVYRALVAKALADRGLDDLIQSGKASVTVDPSTGAITVHPNEPRKTP